MPGWTPNWADVRFDHAAAGQAADACERAARSLHDASAARRRAGHQATATAAGSAIQALVRAGTALDRRDQQVEQALRAAADALRAAADRARRDQAGRMADRAAWQREADAERLRPAPPAMAGPDR